MKRDTRQMLNPPFATPGVFSQMSCVIVVHSPVLKVQDPRPIDIPYTALQSGVYEPESPVPGRPSHNAQENGLSVHSAGTCFARGAYRYI
jgi:hypothetical protein